MRIYQALARRNNKLFKLQILLILFLGNISLLFNVSTINVIINIASDAISIGWLWYFVITPSAK